MTLHQNLLNLVANIATAMKGRISTTEKGTVNGVATLDDAGKLTVSQLPATVATLENGRIPAAQLPGFVDDVVEVASRSILFPAEPGVPPIGLAGTIYITLDDDREYRWTGTAYRELSKNEVTTKQLTNVSDVTKAASGLAPTAYETNRTYRIGEVAYWADTNETLQAVQDNVTAAPYSAPHTSATSTVLIPDDTELMGSGRLKMNGVFVVSDTEDMSYDQFIGVINAFGGGTVYTAVLVNQKIVITRKDGGVLDLFVDDGDNTLFELSNGSFNSLYWKVVKTVDAVNTMLENTTDISKAYAGLPVREFNPGRVYKLGEVAYSANTTKSYQTIVDNVTTTPLTALPNTVITASVLVPDDTELMDTGSLKLNGVLVISDTRFMSYNQFISEINAFGGGTVYTASIVDGVISIKRLDNGVLTEFAEVGSNFGFTLSTGTIDGAKWKEITPIGVVEDDTDFAALFAEAMLA